MNTKVEIDYGILETAAAIVIPFYSKNLPAVTPFRRASDDLVGEVPA